MSKPTLAQRYKAILKELHMKDYEMGKVFGYDPDTWKNASRKDKLRKAIVFLVERTKALMQ